MKEFLAVLSYTFKENMRKKVFIISTIIIIVLTVVIVSLPGIITAFNDKGKSSTSNASQPSKSDMKGTVLIVDSKNIYTSDLTEISKIFSSYSFKLENLTDINKLKDKVNKENT